MTLSSVFMPRVLIFAVLVGGLAGAAHIGAPGAAFSAIAPVENTHLLPEQDEAFRVAMAALDTPIAMAC